MRAGTCVGTVTTQAARRTSLLKGIFGFGIGCGLFALTRHALPDPSFAIPQLADEARRLTDWTPVFGGLVGAVYGAWVELDDPPKRRERRPKEPASKAG